METEKKMQILIISVVYVIAATILLSCAVRTFLRMNDKDGQMYRQYFFTVLLLLFILITSFIAILLRLHVPVPIGAGGGIGFSIGKNSTNGYGIIAYIGLIIIVILLMSLFDRYVLKRRSKTEQEYRIRRRIAVGIILLLIGTIAVLKAVTA